MNRERIARWSSLHLQYLGVLSTWFLNPTIESSLIGVLNLLFFSLSLNYSRILEIVRCLMLTQTQIDLTVEDESGIGPEAPSILPVIPLAFI